MTKSTIILPLLCALLVGCESTPGHISTRVSKFDGSTEISSTPAWVLDGMGGFRVGLHHSSQMPATNLVLTAMVRGAHNIAAGESLKFNIDGTIVSLRSMDELTHVDYVPGVYNSVAAIPGSNHSSKRYLVDVTLIQRMIAGTKVTGRLELSRDYVEGVFSTDAPTSARPVFRRFLAALENPETLKLNSPTATRGASR